jgi:hypothetical protein
MQIYYFNRTNIFHELCKYITSIVQINNINYLNILNKL